MTFITKREDDATDADFKMFFGNPSNDQLMDSNDEKVKFNYFKPKTNDKAGWKTGTFRADFFDGKVNARVNTFAGAQTFTKEMIEAMKTYLGDAGFTCAIDSN